ncbi:MAG: hypothetical protein JJT75_04115 [Opitutales bacterium]|nr:hypothetical protein [Opitutales bacterium]
MSVLSYKAIIKHYETSPDEVKKFFENTPKLVTDFDYEVAIGYVFLRTELGLNRSIYCGVVKLHRGDYEICRNAINVQHMTREGFLNLFKNVYGKDLPANIRSKIKGAESIRDRVLHGKKVRDPEMRKAICDVLDYAKEMNIFLNSEAGFMPFGDLRGFKGRTKALDKKTTRWILKGMGFGIK